MERLPVRNWTRRRTKTVPTGPRELARAVRQGRSLMPERATRHPRALAGTETTSVDFGLGTGEEVRRRWLDRRRVGRAQVACNLIHP